MTSNSIEIITYLVEGNGEVDYISRTLFHSAVAAANYLKAQGYTSTGVNEYIRRSGRGYYQAVIQDHRPVPRRDWGRLEYTHEGI